MEPTTILLVDDEDAVRMLLCQSLRRCGYTLLEAANGTDALAVTRHSHQPIDILISDVLMPGMNGTELAKKLCAERPTLKVVLISGFCDLPDGVEPGWEFLQKPFPPSVLCEKLKRMLAAAHQEDALREQMRKAREAHT